MKITKINIKNFRLLKNFSIDLEEDLSLVIGKNNCGKTSFLSILHKFINGDKSDRFSFDDLSLEEQENIRVCIMGELSGSTYEKLGISMNIVIDYSGSILKNIPILNLDSAVNSVILNFEYRVTFESIQQLKLDFSKYQTDYHVVYDSNDFFRFMRKNYKDYFSLEIKAIDILDKDNCTKIDTIRLKRIINFQVISAKREVANESSNKTLSTLSHRYFAKSDDPGESHRIDLRKMLIQADKDLTGAYQKTFEKITNSIKILSHNSSEIIIQSDLNELNILKDNTSVVYKNGDSMLPEDYNGLGYMNFFAMIFHIHTICDEFKKKYSKDEPSDINLLFIEEPEAHTHPQMQYVFIQNIKKLLLTERTESGNELRQLQTIITTHSAHITSKSNFNDIKYFLKIEDKNEVEVRNLSQLSSKYGSDPDEKRAFKFLKQYLTIHKSELFFADKVIFIEGDTERILIPAMMQKIDNDNESISGYIPLLSQNISIVDVGANSKTFEKFIDFLGIKSLVITDIDSVKSEQCMDKQGNPIFLSDGTTHKTSETACSVSEGEETSNSSIKFFLEGKTFDEIKNLNEDGKILSKVSNRWQQSEVGQMLIVFQTEENGYHARSFEDAFIALNMSFIKGHKDDFVDGLKNISELDNPTPNFYKIADECIKSKTGFAIDILYYSDDAFADWQVPSYIKHGLLWLSKK